MTPVSLSTVIPTQVGTSASVGALDAGVDALRLAGWGRSNTDGSLDATCVGPGLRRDDGCGWGDACGTPRLPSAAERPLSPILSPRRGSGRRAGAP